MERHIVTLVKKARRGDSKAFVQLCEARHKDILYICIKLMGNREDGEDAAQEVVLQMQSSIRRLKEPQTFDAWLNRIIGNTCRNQKRGSFKLMANTPLEDETDALPEDNAEFLPVAYAEEKEKRELVLQALDELPLQYKQALLLFYFENLSIREMATALDTGEQNVKNWLHRGRAALKRKLEQDDRNSEALAATVPLATLARILQSDAAEIVSEQSAARLMAVSKSVAMAAAGKTALAIGTALLSATVAVGGIAFYATAFAGSGTQTMVQAPSQYVAVQVSPEGPAAAQGGPEHMAEEIAGEPTPETEAETPMQGGQPSPLPQVGGAAQHRQEGRVCFLSAEGHIVQGGGLYAAGFTVTLWRGDTQLASETVEADGGYTLEFEAAAGEVLRLCLVKPGQNAFTFTMQNPGGILEFVFTPEETLPDLFITDSALPTGSISFYGPGGQSLEGGDVDPVHALLELADETDATVTWRLLDETGNPLAAGEGTTVKMADLPLEASDTGMRYLLCFTMADAAGNSTEITREFIVL